MRCFLLLLAAGWIGGGCSQDGRVEGSSPPPPPRMWIGTNFSPPGWPDNIDGAGAVAYFRAHRSDGSHGNLIGYHGNWRDPNGVGGEPTVLALTAQAAKEQYGAEPALGFGWWDERRGPDLASESEPANRTWSNQQTRDEFRRMVAAYCRQYQPRFVFLGNETNSYYLRLDLPAEQRQWDDWVSQFIDCYDAIKAVSPDTIVFTVFQLEQMRGIGARAGWRYNAHWNLIADFGTKLDAVGFTTYPHVEFEAPAAVPADYYEEIRNHWSGPVIFTEVSWPANPADPPYRGDETMQSEWIERFFELISGLDVLYVNHAFLHDPPAAALNVAFGDAGLRSNDGSVVRPADAAWQNAVLQRR